MKRYVGGKDGMVIAIRTDGVDVLDVQSGPLGWGDQSASSARLALALLFDLGLNADDATKYHRRFMHRTITEWKAGLPWTASSDELLAVVDDIKKVEKDTAQDRMRMTREAGRFEPSGPRDKMDWERKR